MYTTMEGGEGALLKTIKISNNLFSVTERLPKPKYRKEMNYSTISIDK